jgi:hypothetical protein
VSLQAGLFWLAPDSRTILVMGDNQQNRRSFSPHIVKTIHLPRETSTNNLNEIVNILRTTLLPRGISPSYTAKAIVIRDTSQRVALAETIVEHLNTSPTMPKSLNVASPRFADNLTWGSAPTARAILRLSAATAVSINLNQDTRSTYEALGVMAGLQVNFSPGFSLGAPQEFRLENVDVLDAMDYWSVVTGTAWTVVDNQTILVFPDTDRNRRNLTMEETRSFQIGDGTALDAFYDVVNVLRAAISIRGFRTERGSLTIQGTPELLSIGEQIVASLDRVP